MAEVIKGTFSPEEAADLEFVKKKLAESAKVPVNRLRLMKKSLDARGRAAHFFFTAEISQSEVESETPGFHPRNVSGCREVHIIGFGPAGIFAALKLIEEGLKPVIIERGKDISDRRRDLAILNKQQIVNPDSNYCFGEGGAGTYSDGKLYTRSSKRGPVEKVLNTFIQFGAAGNIAYEAHPHIGTNKLPGIIENIREQILACGGEIHFNTRLTDIDTAAGLITGIKFADSSSMKVDQLLLATGHSARDIYELLERKGIAIESKPFALGVRIEHPQEVINEMQYAGKQSDFLPPASYNLVEKGADGKGIFSFCMCPGGIIAPAATAPGEIVVNGWSPSKRNGRFANSGFVVTVDDKDVAPFADKGNLRGLAFQALYEQKAFETSQSLIAPSQRMEDFLQRKQSANLPDCSYIPGIVARKMDEVLPNFVSEAIRKALLNIGAKHAVYRTNEAVLVGVESRTSSPVRIPRDKEMLCHPEYANFYPCAEGAGYAGGIVSAALDGYRCAGMILQKMKMKP